MENYQSSAYKTAAPQTASHMSVHLFVLRYVVGSNRVLFMLKDGAKAWEIKDFLVRQDRCEVVTIENQDYPGKGASSKVNSRRSQHMKDMGPRL